jgi:predicted RNase H-like HicB family nuclease
MTGMTKRRRRRASVVTPQLGDEDAVSSSLDEAPGQPEPSPSPSPTPSPKEYLKLPYTIAVRADERNGGWTASVEELPGCDAHGDDPEHATRGLRGAMERWVSEALERGEHVPEPRAMSGHSGRLLLRMPQSLHAELARNADGEGISLNQFITTALASAVGWRNHAAPDARRRGSPSEEATSAGAGTRQVRRSRRQSVLLATNLIVLIILAALAIVLLLTAWYES